MSTGLENRIETAKQGRMLWLKLIEEYHIDNTVYVILMPHKGEGCNYPFLKYLGTFLKKRGIRRSLLMTEDEWVLSQKHLYDKIADVVYLSQEQIKTLIQFYQLYEFAPNLVVASLRYPSGRMGEQLIGKKGLTEKEVVRGIVYSLVDDIECG